MPDLVLRGHLSSVEIQLFLSLLGGIIVSLLLVGLQPKPQISIQPSTQTRQTQRFSKVTSILTLVYHGALSLPTGLLLSLPFLVIPGYFATQFSNNAVLNEMWMAVAFLFPIPSILLFMSALRIGYLRFKVAVFTFAFLGLLSWVAPATIELLLNTRPESPPLLAVPHDRNSTLAFAALIAFVWEIIAARITLVRASYKFIEPLN